MVTDSIRGGTPLVEMVDNFTNNRRLATLYEGRVGKGELVIASFDLQSDLDDRPVARLGRITAKNLLRMMEDENWQERNYSYRFPVKLNDGNSVRAIDRR